MMSGTIPFDAAKYLTTEEARAEYLKAMAEEADPALLADALGTVARAQRIMIAPKPMPPMDEQAVRDLARRIIDEHRGVLVALKNR